MRSFLALVALPVSAACLPEDKSSDDTGSRRPHDTAHDSGSGDSAHDDTGGFVDVDHDGIDDETTDQIIANPGGKVCWSTDLAPKGTKTAGIFGRSTVGAWSNPVDHTALYESGGAHDGGQYCYPFEAGDYALLLQSNEVLTKTGVHVQFDLESYCTSGADPICYGTTMTCFRIDDTGAVVYLSLGECSGI